MSAPSRSAKMPLKMAARMHSAGKTSFYQNKVLEQYASKGMKTVSLRQLTVFGRHVTLDKLLKAGNYIRLELPVRLAHRIRCFQQLPFVMGVNPHIEKIYNLYWDAFEQFRSVPEIKTLEENTLFCNMIRKQLDNHGVAIPTLARGIAESHAHMSYHEADKFMNETLRSRIGRRVLAEHHLSLSDAFNGEVPQPYMIGIVNVSCRAHLIIQKCVDISSRMFTKRYNVPAPQVIVKGYLGATFQYIPDHIEYILFELIKNSMRFTAQEHLKDSNADTTLPPIKITIGQDQSQIVFRVSDQAGGIPKATLNNIWSWTHAAQRNLKRLEHVHQLAGKVDSDASFTTPLGLGLPMSLVYTHYWGGTISLYTMPGYGTDFYVTLSTANHLEQLHFE